MENLHLRALKSFYSHQHGGLITLEDDVLSIVSQVREEFGDKVSIQLDPVTSWYHFVGMEDEGNTQRLIFSVEHLDPRALERLRQADSHARGFQDPYLAAEREQDELDAAKEAAFREKVREGGERLAHEFKKEGVMPRLPLSVPVTKDLSANA